MAEEEVLAEVEAVEAVYGDDCLVVDKYPPHIHLHIKPRTADITSQQFVEAVLGIRAGSQYPNEPPEITIVDSKGLDQQRRADIIAGIHKKAYELASYLMLIALCEEAVEKLTVMNHPDGDCPLCLCPLVEEDAGDNHLPFMKLMSCFHCFHSECIIRWWNWLQTQKGTESSSFSSSAHGVHGETEGVGTCPVCRKVFHGKDIEHVLDLVGNHSPSVSEEVVANSDETLLQSDSENIRRQKFEATLKLQQEHSGLIEPKKTEVLMPGMFLPLPIAPSPDERERDPTVENESSSSSVKAERKYSKNTRKKKGRNYGNQTKQWIKKENGTNN